MVVKPNIPDDYWGEPVDDDGVFRKTKTMNRIVDHCDGYWYYGHDEYFAGGCFAWMRLVKQPDQTLNDINKMKVENGKWLLMV